jgi:hypothetical protein
MITIIGIMEPIPAAPAAAAFSVKNRNIVLPPKRIHHIIPKD